MLLCTANNKREKLCISRTIPAGYHASQLPMHTYTLDHPHQLFLINPQDSFAALVSLYKRTPRTAWNTKKRRTRRKRVLFLFTPIEILTFFEQNAHKLLKQYPLIYRNWVKFPLRLSFIRPYSTCRNWEHSLNEACFVLRGDSSAGRCWFWNHSLYLTHQFQFTNTNKTIVSSLIVASL